MLKRSANGYMKCVERLSFASSGGGSGWDDRSRDVPSGPRVDRGLPGSDELWLLVGARGAARQVRSGRSKIATRIASHRLPTHHLAAPLAVA